MAINVSQAFHRTSANPVDDTLALTKAEMRTVNDNLMPAKYMTVCQNDGKLYLYDKTNNSDPETGKFRELQTGGGGTSYTAGDGIDITDDTISIDPMPANDMDEVVTPVPGTHAKRIKYSLDEQIIGEWIDGKPLYQKTVAVRTGNCTTAGAIVQTEFPFTTDEVNWSSIISTNYQTTFISNLMAVPIQSGNTDYRLLGVRIVASASSKAIVVQCTIPAFANIDFYATVHYTKTTD